MSNDSERDNVQPEAPEGLPPVVPSPVAEAAMAATPEPVAKADEEDPAFTRWRPRDVSTGSERKYQARVPVLTADGRAVITATFMIPATRPSVLLDLCVTAGKDIACASAAAIGVCWFGTGRPKAARAAYESGLTYGRAVADELLLAGMSQTQLYVLGGFLIEQCAAAMPEELEESGFFG